MAISISGTAHKNITSGSSTTVALTTSGPAKIIVVATINQTTDAPMTSISSANTSGWSLRARQANGTAGNSIEIWSGVAAAALTSEIITLTFAGSIGFGTFDIFGVAGADAAIWDANAALPDKQTTGTCSITTTASETMLLGCYRCALSNPTAGAGWSVIGNTNFQLVEYKLVSSPQSAMPAAISSGTPNAGLGDAIVALASPSGRGRVVGSPILDSVILGGLAG